MDRVAIIIERTNVALGGGERSVFELSGALSASGLDVDILAAKGETNAKHIHVLCGESCGKRVCHSTFGKALREYLETNHYDIVHSVLPFEFADIYQPRGGSFAEAVLQNAVSYQNRLIETYKMATAFTNSRRSQFLRAEKKLCGNPQGPIVAALSDYVARQFKEHYNLCDGRLKVIANGVKINKNVDRDAADKLRSQILFRLGLKEADRPVFFLFAANNFRLKGLDCLIKAMHLAESDNKTSRPYLLVAGNGKTRKYRLLAKKLNVADRVLFLGALRNIQDVLTLSDIGILPTFYDPASRFILEALAAGKPVITTAFNGATDMFVNDRHGKIIDSPRNTSALARAIGYFTETENIKAAARAIETDNLAEAISIGRVAEQMIDLYGSIAENRRQK